MCIKIFIKNYNQDKIRKKEMRYTKFCSPIAFVFVFILLSPVALASSMDSEFPQIIVQKQSGFTTADLSARVTNGNHPFSEQFANISQNITRRNRNFEDGNTPIDQNPNPFYSTKGNYAVNLTVNDEKDTESKNLETSVNKVPNKDQVLPVANFVSNVSSGYTSRSVLSKDLLENATLRDWDFNNDETADSSDQRPVYLSPTPGNDIFNLTERNGIGTNSKRSAITVFNPADPVFHIANFHANVTSGKAPLSVQFTDLSQNVTGRSWNFGDGNSSIEQNPKHTYFATGNYTVNLTVNNDNGTNSKILEIIVHEVPNNDKILPVANIASNVTSGYAPLSVLFTDLSQNAIIWNWNFGDGATSTEQNPMHTYPAEGTYTVNLEVSNANGTASKTVTITVYNHINTESSGGGGITSGSSHSSVGTGLGGDSGTGDSPEPKSNVLTKEISQALIKSGKPAKFDFIKNTTSVIYVSFDSKKTTGKTTNIIEMLKEKSTLVSGLPSGEIYKYLNIWVGDKGFAIPNNIENPIVCFKVEKSWIQDKNINQSSIVLNRYSDNKWNQLPTSLSGKDDRYLYFITKTPGFSPFAITGMMTAEESMTGKQKSEQKGSTSTSGKGGNNMSVLGMICLIACLLAIFLYKINQKE
jgi:PGF-pre-PGF domain-containing protein